MTNSEYGTGATVIHIEDEPWDYEHIVRELRAGLYLTLDDNDRASIKLSKVTPTGNYPLCWLLTWKDGETKNSLRYWFVQNLAEVDSIDQRYNTTKSTASVAYLLDVMRVDDRGMISANWGELVKFVRSRVVDVDAQVRLYTAFEIEMDGYEFEGVKFNAPPIIQKGDPEIINFLLNFSMKHAREG